MKQPAKGGRAAAGSLDQHFKSSSFFDETRCRHDYKLVGSKIYSSGRFHQQMAVDATEAATSKGGGEAVCVMLIMKPLALSPILLEILPWSDKKWSPPEQRALPSADGGGRDRGGDQQERW